MHSYSIKTNSLVQSTDDKTVTRSLQFFLEPKEGVSIEITERKHFYVALGKNAHVENPEQACTVKMNNEELPFQYDSDSDQHYWRLAPQDSVKFDGRLDIHISKVHTKEIEQNRLSFGFQGFDDTYSTGYLFREVLVFPLMKLSLFSALLEEKNAVIRLSFVVENALRATMDYQSTDPGGKILAQQHWTYDAQHLKDGGTWDDTGENPDRLEKGKINHFFHNAQEHISPHNTCILWLYGGGGQTHTATWVTGDAFKTRYAPEYPNEI